MGQHVVVRWFEEFLEKSKNPCKPKVYKDFYVVGVKRLELPTSCSQSRRATNCATPRFFIKLFPQGEMITALPKAGATLAVPEIVRSLFTSHNFDRYANKRSLPRPQDAFACVANCATPRCI